MLSGLARLLAILVLYGIFRVGASAQQMAPGKPAPQKRTELGLDEAVKWEWKVVPSDEKDWGLPSATPTPTPTPAPTPTVPQPENRPTLYEVKKGDALVLIGKKFGITVSQIQSFNALKGDKIRAGQTLKIPSLAEVSAMAPPPRPPKKHETTGTSDAKLTPEIALEQDRLRLQIFLDREQFSSGPIVVEPGPTFTRVLLFYQSTHEDAKDDASLEAKAQAAVPNVFTHYKLRAEDFRFIAPPRAETPAPRSTPVPAHARPAKPALRSPALTRPPLTYQQLTMLPMLAYRSPWEFVAERFHCQESYLHTLNGKLPPIPAIGADFQVPNVIPFEIENAFDEPLQPQADPKKPVTAAVIALSQLNIYQGGALVAVFPLSPARPGLHGRNAWTILDAIPRPRLATFQKERVEQTPRASPLNGIALPEPTPTPKPVLTSEQYLAAGPRNPVGILWINLAKARSTEPLAYGLSGTSIPDQMNFEQSIGGFRLTNWDIARAVRHLPSGTPLEWK
jgi:LysM repeat protein/lipoprotein-anchoring transpeptidase ErfK/SrfK